jgi:hypothetical protein
MTIARREGVIAPCFEEGKTPPVFASFRTDAGWYNYLNPFVSMSSVFAGGDAAVAMSSMKPTSETEYTKDKLSSFTLSKSPKGGIVPDLVDAGRAIVGKTSLRKPGRMHPFVFGTDTSFGLKVAWSGTTGQYPDSVKLGLSRKEFALAPVFEKMKESTGKGKKEPTGKDKGTPVVVKMPSFLAVLDHITTLTKGSEYTGHVQYFATGKAATILAGQSYMQKAIMERADPLAAGIKADILRYQQDTQRILGFVGDTKGKVDGARLEKLTRNTGLGLEWVKQFSGKDLSRLREALEGLYQPSVPGLAANIDGGK